MATVSIHVLYLLPYPVFGTAHVGEGGMVQPVGEAVIVRVLVYDVGVSLGPSVTMPLSVP